MTEKESTPKESGPDTEASDEQLGEKEIAKRKMLKKLALGTGLAATSPAWVKPVVKTVILPKSAMAASCVTQGPWGCGPSSAPG
ncbi:MAG: hypothetical protein GY746_12995 [Gammaproteobacteria bacterium]|nr:hypothetical protein [Gammaproteobacteria bacterium]